VCDLRHQPSTMIGTVIEWTSNEVCDLRHQPSTMIGTVTEWTSNKVCDLRHLTSTMIGTVTEWTSNKVCDLRHLTISEFTRRVVRRTFQQLIYTRGPFRLPHLSISTGPPSDELDKTIQRTSLGLLFSHWNGYSHFRSSLNWFRK
jgi:hypothetical protein